MTDTMKGLQLSIETVFDAADGGRLFQVRCIADHSAFTICPPRKDRLEAVSLRRAFEDALRSVIAAEVEASRLPQAGAAPPLVQWGPILDALDGLPNDLRDEFEHLDQLIRREHERGLAFLDASPAPSDAAAALPNLWPVIQWLEGGCDPQEAAKELRIYAERAATSPLPTAPAGAREAMVPAWKLQQSETRMLNMKLDLIRVAQGEATLCNFPEVEELRAALAAAPLDRIAQIDDDSDALTIAYMHGFASGKRYGITLAQGEAKGDGNG